jgi:polar amino acid transport system substrate-binding protein
LGRALTAAGWARRAFGATRSRRAVLLGTVLLVAAALLAVRLWPRGDPALHRVIESGVWRVGMDPSFPPFENLNAEGQPVGFDVDLAHAIAARWGVQVAISGVGFDQVLDAVAAHRVDSAISALPYVDNRADVAFSVPYFDAGLVLAVPPDRRSLTPDGLAGLRVAAEWGSQGHAEGRALQRRLPGGFSLVLRDTPDQALQAVSRGEADAALVDAVSLALHGPAGGLVAAAGPPVVSNPYVIVVPAKSPQMLALINRTLQELAADGTLAHLHARWLGPP